MVELQEQHPRCQREWSFLGIGFVFAIGVPVDVRDGVDARVALVATSLTRRIRHFGVTSSGRIICLLREAVASLRSWSLNNDRDLFEHPHGD
jgi:hypothetical protein